MPLQDAEPALTRRALLSLPASPGSKFYAPVKVILEMGNWAKTMTRGQLRQFQEAKLVRVAARTSAATTPDISPTLIQETPKVAETPRGSFLHPLSEQQEALIASARAKHATSKKAKERSAIQGSLPDLSILDSSIPEINEIQRSRRTVASAIVPQLSPEKSKNPEMSSSHAEVTCIGAPVVTLVTPNTSDDKTTDTYWSDREKSLLVIAGKLQVERDATTELMKNAMQQAQETQALLKSYNAKRPEHTPNAASDSMNNFFPGEKSIQQELQEVDGVSTIPRNALSLDTVQTLRKDLSTVFSKSMLPNPNVGVKTSKIVRTDSERERRLEQSLQKKRRAFKEASKKSKQASPRSRETPPKKKCQEEREKFCSTMMTQGSAMLPSLDRVLSLTRGTSISPITKAKALPLTAPALTERTPLTITVTALDTPQRQILVKEKLANFHESFKKSLLNNPLPPIPKESEEGSSVCAAPKVVTPTTGLYPHREV